METAKRASLSANTDAIHLSRKIGFGMAVTSTVFGILYLAGLVGNFATTGSFYPVAAPIQLLSASIALLWDQVLVVLFIALRWQAPENKKILAEIALVFMILVCAMSSISWFVRLAIVPKVAQAGDLTLLSLLDPYNSSSITYATEHLGWGLFYGLATLFAAFAIDSGRFKFWLRWLLAAGAILSVSHVLGVIVSSPVLIFLGFPAWGVLLPATTALLAVRFRGN